VAYTLALGPFHPMWRGSQRFIVRISGERVADVEYQGGLNERGCAERIPRLSLHEALHLVARTCGACSIAHQLAFSGALEQLCSFAVAERAAYLRTVAAELERGASHLAAAAGMLQALGMASADAFDRLNEQCRALLAALAGSRVGPHYIVPGGVARDLSARARDELLESMAKLNAAIYARIDRLIDGRALLARTIEVGALPRSAAEQFGVRGPLARASGIPRDARADHAYAAYPQLSFRPLTQEGGDVYARLVLVLLEGYEAIKLAEQALRALPEEDWSGRIISELPRGKATGAAEGPRGMIRYNIESDGYRITEARVDTPRQLDRLLARTLLSGALVDNIAAIIASVDACPACAER
jgi:Ni,Fe-hydrogenase III large subunit